MRLAVRTEDHPIEYLEFSGEIPAGEYGGGRMTIWDTGTYETEKWNAREVIVAMHGATGAGPFRLHPHRPRGGERRARTTGCCAVPTRRPTANRCPPTRCRRWPTPGPLPRGDGWWLQVGFRRAAGDRPGGGRPGPGHRRRRRRAVGAPRCAGSGPSLGATQVLLDGELTDRGELWIGDLLHLDGRDARPLPFRERRALLEGLPLHGPALAARPRSSPTAAPRCWPRWPRRACRR